VIPASFDYVRADSADAAVALLTEHGDEAKLLAGGHSLLPLMKLRLATPSVLIDVGRLRDLSYINDAGDHIAIGALTRHRDVETSDLPSVVLALGGTLVARGPSGERTIAAGDFFQGFLETALAPDELLTEIRVPKTGGAGWSFQKFNRRAQDWAIVGVAAVVGNGSTGVGLVNMGSTPVRASATEAALASGASAADAAAVAAEGTEPPADLNATPEFREHLARVLVRRALEECGV
jgi:carbon-monoxide dehydrogenase medium subunit